MLALPTCIASCATPSMLQQSGGVWPSSEEHSGVLSVPGDARRFIKDRLNMHPWPKGDVDGGVRSNMASVRRQPWTSPACVLRHRRLGAFQPGSIMWTRRSSDLRERPTSVATQTVVTACSSSNDKYLCVRHHRAARVFGIAKSCSGGYRETVFVMSCSRSAKRRAHGHVSHSPLKRSSLPSFKLYTTEQRQFVSGSVPLWSWPPDLRLDFVAEAALISFRVGGFYEVWMSTFSRFSLSLCTLISGGTAFRGVLGQVRPQVCVFLDFLECQDKQALKYFAFDPLGDEVVDAAGRGRPVWWLASMVQDYMLLLRPLK